MIIISSLPFDMRDVKKSCLLLESCATVVGRSFRVPSAESNSEVWPVNCVK